MIINLLTRATWGDLGVIYGDRTGGRADGE